MIDKYDLLQAMSGIRDEYIEEASRPLTDKEAGPEKQHSLSPRPPSALRRRRVRAPFLAAAAAVLLISIALPNLSPGASSLFQGIPLLGNYFRLVTIRSYEYQSESADAYAEEPALVTMSKNNSTDRNQDQDKDSLGIMSSGEIELEEAAEYKNADVQTAGAADTPASEYEEGEEDSNASVTAVLSSAEFDDSDQGQAASIAAVLSAAQITEEIRQTEQEAVLCFEQNVSQETGYHTLRFLHRTVTDTADWYCLEVLSYTASADGFEQVDHFTVNKKTGKRVELEDLFRKDADFITPVSQEIISQMRAQMAENPEIEYWIDSEEDPEYDFSRIREDQDFYIDDQGRLVICFNEMEAAPMYMGTVEFIIPDKVLSSIRIQ